jgi:hypothetical protein
MKYPSPRAKAVPIENFVSQNLGFTSAPLRGRQAQEVRRYYSSFS